MRPSVLGRHPSGMQVPAEIELPPPPTGSSSSEAMGNIDELEDDALDHLPFGVVGLDARGRVRRYNLAEARLARLDRQAVLGQHFFEKVAPCTATPEFEGRVRAFLAGGAGPVRFSYVFDFRFGAQEVEVELIRGGRRAAVYLLINRQRFREVRPPEQARAPAVTLAELRPDERELGVRRPEASAGSPTSMQRQVVMPAAFFGALRGTWDRVAPGGGPVFSLAWGELWGRLTVIELDTLSVEATGKGLRELTTTEALARVNDELSARGLGTMRTTFEQTKNGVVVIHVERSLLAEAGGPSALPRCWLLAGFFQAIFSHLGHKKLHVREGCCAAQGHQRCSFSVVGDIKKQRLLELVHPKNVAVLKDSDDFIACLVAP